MKKEVENLPLLLWTINFITEAMISNYTFFSESVGMFVNKFYFMKYPSVSFLFLNSIPIALIRITSNIPISFVKFTSEDLVYKNINIIPYLYIMFTCWFLKMTYKNK